MRLARYFVTVFSLTVLLTLARTPKGHTQTCAPGDVNCAYNSGKSAADASAVNQVPPPTDQNQQQSKGSCG